MDSFEEEAEIDVVAVKGRIAEIERQLEETKKQMNQYFQELGL